MTAGREFHPALRNCWGKGTKNLYMLLKFVWEFVRKFVWDTFTGFSEHPAQREAIDAREAMDGKSLPGVNRLTPRRMKKQL